MTRNIFKLSFLGLLVVMWSQGTSRADECLFINGNRPIVENEVHAFRLQAGSVPVEAEGSPFKTRGLGGVQGATQSLVARGEQLWVLNSGASGEGSVAGFRIAEDCRLEFQSLSEPTPGFSFAMIVDRSEQFLYVTNGEERSISVFERDEHIGWRLVGNVPTPRTALGLVQDPQSGFVYVVFFNAPGFGVYRRLENGLLELRNIEIGLHAGLLLPPTGRTLFSYWSRFDGGLNVLGLDESGVPTLEEGSPWPGPIGISDMVYIDSLSLLVAVNGTRRELAAFEVDGVRIEQRPFSPVPGLPAVSRGLAVDQNRQFYVVSLQRLLTFTVGRDAIEPVEPALILPTGEKAGLIVHPAPRALPITDIPTLSSRSLVVQAIVLAIATLAVLVRRRK
ncbi:MAG: hypothetical protein AAGM22_19660 [Acidobacteriota bacterium]